MKTTLQLTLNSTFYGHAATHNFENGTELSIHEFFRDHFAYKCFKTCNIQQDGRTGVYTLEVEPSSKDVAPFPQLLARFCESLYANGVNVAGYAHNVQDVTVWVDMDALEYYANIDNGPVPDAMSESYAGIAQWVDGYKQAMQSIGVTVRVTDLTEEA